MQIPEDQIIFLMIALEKLLAPQALVVSAVGQQEDDSLAADEVRISFVVKPAENWFQWGQACSCPCHTLIEQAQQRKIDVNATELCWNCNHRHSDGHMDKQGAAKHKPWIPNRPEWLQHEMEIAADNPRSSQ